MHFKENQIAKESLEAIADHFRKISRRSLTPEQLLGFKRDTPYFVINRRYVSDIQRDFTNLVIVADLIDKFVDTDKSITNINLFTRSLKKSHFSHDDASGVIDKRYVNGQMSIYKEWVDFAESHGIKSSQNFDEIKKTLMESSVFLKKASMTVKNLAMISTEIENNKKNTIYISALIDEFKEFYNDKVGSSNTFFMLINQHAGNYEDALQKMSTDIETMKKDIHQVTPDVFKTMAHKFCESQVSTDNEISSFLKSKNFDDLIDTRLQLKGQSRPDNILFKDGSYAYSSEGQYHHTTNEHDYYTQQNELHYAVIGYLSRKKPKIAAFFKQFVEDESGINVIPVLDTYQQYSDVISHAGINILQLTNKSMEVVDDTINAAILAHKTNQYVNSILSNKYEYLLTPESRDILKILYETGVSKQSLQDYIGKKIAALKTPEEFLSYVTNVKDHFSGFSQDALKIKLEGNGIKPCYDKDGIVIFHVENFEMSKKLGSVSWCISRNEYHFDNYTDSDSRQYFMYDFNKKESDNTSMVGFTLYQSGGVSASHLKNDDDFDFSSKYNMLHLEVLKNDFKLFKLDKEYSKIMKEKYNLDNDKEKPKKTGLKL